MGWGKNNDDDDTNLNLGGDVKFVLQAIKWKISYFKLFFFLLFLLANVFLANVVGKKLVLSRTNLCLYMWHIHFNILILCCFDYLTSATGETQGRHCIKKEEKRRKNRHHAKCASPLWEAFYRILMVVKRKSFL